MNIIYIMGKSSSGKDTIFNIIKNKLEVNTYVMYTTRPIREGEIPGETYNFVSTEEFERMIKDGELYEYDVHHNHYYGTSRKILNESRYKKWKPL